MDNNSRFAFWNICMNVFMDKILIDKSCRMKIRVSRLFIYVWMDGWMDKILVDIWCCRIMEISRLCMYVLMDKILVNKTVRL